MLYYNTVNELLKQILLTLMSAEVFVPFRLVGGTALSLQLGHRMSIDIDLFSDAPYGSIDFNQIDSYLTHTFPYVTHFANLSPGMGKSYVVGSSKEDTIKLDVFYSTEPFIQPPLIVDGIRLATVEEIIAMKVDVVQRGGRKKDFWDLHEVLPQYNIERMLNLHSQRHEYNHDRALILANFINFSQADEDFDPVCLKGKYWAFIKEDIQNAV